MSENKKCWRERALDVARECDAAIVAAHPNVVANRALDGMGLSHALFMARVLQGITVGEVIDSDTKACRWLGWLQCILAYEGVSTLNDAKQANLGSGK